MKKLIRAIRGILILLPFFVLCVVFRYWLEFSDKQSVVLAGLVWTGYISLKYLNDKAEKEDFEPYNVSIKVKSKRAMLELLVKHKLINNDSREIEKVFHNLIDDGFLNRGLNFTVLSESKYGQPHVIWWHDKKIFITGNLSFEVNINEFKLPWDDSEGSVLKGETWSPSIYFGYKHAATKQDGYTLALRVNKSWWDVQKTENVVTTKDNSGYGDSGFSYLHLATLPFSEIGMNYEEHNQNREKELSERGWIAMDDLEGYYDFYQWKVENEYFSITVTFP